MAWRTERRRCKFWYVAYRILQRHRVVSLLQHGFLAYISDRSMCWNYKQYADGKSRWYAKITAHDQNHRKVAVIVNIWLFYSANKYYNKCSCLYLRYFRFIRSATQCRYTTKTCVSVQCSGRRHEHLLYLMSPPRGSRLLPRLRNLQRHRAVLPAIARLFLFYRLLRHIGFLLAPSSAAAGETLHLSSDGNNTSPVHVQIKLLPSRTGVSDERIQCNLLHLLLTCTSRRSLSRYRTYSVSP